MDASHAAEGGGALSKLLDALKSHLQVGEQSRFFIMALC
jgi:hypothetical protein